MKLVSIDRLGKKYRIGGDRYMMSTLRDRLGDMFRARGPVPDATEFWALRDVSFDVHENEVTGIIGRNGAGKSTLLKIVSEISEPTEGEVRLRGRVSSLLEVGVGFHPELTGRENVFLNGAILGMTRAEIKRKFAEIVAFAEVEQFIDTPVKRFSSGMYVRLAFAVAAHLEPAVLIVDEVLAVGDIAFQRKCLGKMEEISKQGRAVLVVTHNMSIVTQLCGTVVWLDKGRVVEAGETRSVVSKYMSQGVNSVMSWRPDRPASDVFIYHEVAVRRMGEESDDDAIPGDAGVDLVFDYTVHGDIPPGRLSFRVNREDGLVVFTSSNTDTSATSRMPWTAGRHRVRCTIPGELLAPAKYFVTISEPLTHGNALHENVISFTITEQNSLAARDRRQGVVAPRLEWREEPS
jgi:lipopolysaccharide transport system ATP-binding protein